MLFSRLLYCLPKRFLTVLHQEALVVPHGYSWSFTIRPNDLREDRLPRDITEGVHWLVSMRYVDYYVLIPIVSNEAPEEAAWMTDGEDNILLDEPYIQYHYFCYAMGDQEVCRNAPQYDGRFV